MKIYTKTGDKGKTSLFDGERVSKDDIRVESYGTIDELNTTLGLARNYSNDPKITEIILRIQRTLFNVAGELATKDIKKFPEKVDESDVLWLEQIIDHYLDLMDRDKVFQFIIPGSNLLSASLHISRTVCRRAERRILTLAQSEEIRAQLVKYVNRLSDAIYSMARFSESETIHVVFNRSVTST